jgi:hypothetical protein
MVSGGFGPLSRPPRDYGGRLMKRLAITLCLLSLSVQVASAV